MTRIAIIIGSTRPNRIAPTIANWVLENTQGRNDAEYELVDIADFNLPLLDEALAEHPDRIAGVAIRQLSPGEHVLSHGTTTAISESGINHGPDVPTIFGRDGHELLRRYQAEPFPKVLKQDR